MIDRYHDFSILDHGLGRLEVTDVPPVGARSLFAMSLLADIAANQGVGVDDEGRLVILGLVFRPVGFDSGSIQFGQPQWLVCERVA